MQLCIGRPLTVASLAMVFRKASSFVGPVVQSTAARYSGDSRMRMSAGSTAASRPGVPIIDATAAELKAERLWSMADALKPMAAAESTMAVAAEAEDQGQSSIVRKSKIPALAGASGLRERDNFIEGEGEMSAMRRYQYTDQLVADDDSEDAGDDGNEYYI